MRTFEAIVTAPFVTIMVAPSWVLVLCPLVTVAMLFFAVQKYWKSYAAVCAAVAVGITASICAPREYTTSGPALAEDKIFIAAMNMGIVVMFTVVLIISLAVGLRAPRRDGAFKGPIK